MSHKTILDADIVDFNGIVGYFVRRIMRELRILSKYESLFEKVKEFIQDMLFGKTVDIASANALRNLVEPAAARTAIETFKKVVNKRTVRKRKDARIQDCIKLQHSEIFDVNEQSYIAPKKSVFNKIVRDGRLELDFTALLERYPNVNSYVKNYFAIGSKLDYMKTNGDIANYYPDFIGRTVDGRIVIVELKGKVDEDVPIKMERLKQWRKECSQMQLDGKYDFVFVNDEGFRNFPHHLPRF